MARGQRSIGLLLLQRIGRCDVIDHRHRRGTLQRAFFLRGKRRGVQQWQVRWRSSEFLDEFFRATSNTLA